MANKLQVLCFTPKNKEEDKAVLKELQVLGFLDDAVQLYRDCFGSKWRKRNQGDFPVSKWPDKKIITEKIAPGVGVTYHGLVIAGKLVAASYTGILPNESENFLKFLNNNAAYLLTKYQNPYSFKGLMVADGHRSSQFQFSNGQTVAQKMIELRINYCKQQGSTGALMYSSAADGNKKIIKRHKQLGWNQISGIPIYKFYTHKDAPVDEFEPELVFERSF